VKTGCASLKFFIDQPSSWLALGHCLIIRGWCFTQLGESIEAIRLRTADLTLNGVIGLPRPDVKAALPEAPDNNTGFEIRGTLPPGRSSISLEARLPDGTWHELISLTVKIRREFPPFWFGGGTVTELIGFQMPAHMSYPARPVAAEKFPPAARRPRPKLSIVTPSYNQARYLAETMRSVLEQDAAVDYVVQDGLSTDGSKALIERLAAEAGGRRPEAGIQNSEHKNQRSVVSDLPPASSLQPMSSIGSAKDDPSSLLPSPGAPASEFRSPVSGLRPPVRPRLLQWSSEPDSGQADAIIRGFAKTSGGPDDLMAWINSDDFYLPGALGFVSDYFARHPEVDVVYGHRIVVDEASQEIGRWFLPRHDPEVLRLNDFVPQETLFWRRRIWDKVGGLDTSFNFALDWDLLLRFQAAGAKIVRVPYFLACFRVHSAQKTSARMHDVGQKEITLLRERTQGRAFPPQDLEQNPRLLRYLRRSAFIEFLWKLGLRAP
jgi:glycosyltransferase involved in cell wall biosynthesis